MPERHTERGFGIYADITGQHGNSVRVQQSSLATDDCAWIFCDHSEQGTRDRDRFLSRWPGRFDGIDLDELAAFLSPTPHLTVSQAKQVRDALDEFIREHEETADACRS